MASRNRISEVVAQSNLLEEAGDPEGAIAILTEAIRLVTDEPWLLARRGRLHRIREEWKEAVEDFDIALKLKPDAPTTLFYRGTCQAELGEYEKAIADLEGCIKLQPGSADAFWHLGTIHSFRGDLAQTIAAYEKAFFLDPGHFPGLKEELEELKHRLAESDEK